MTFEQFLQEAEAMYADIPAEFLEGLQGLHVFKNAKPEAGLRGVYRMGEYLDAGPEAFLGNNIGLGRQIALYYGSFLAVARGKPAFDWEAELWDTLTHEVRHHVESLAGDASLIAEDRARMAAFRRRRG